MQALIRAKRLRQFAAARDVIGVHMRIDHIQDLEPQRTRNLAIGVEIGARVYDGADAAAPSAEDV